MTFICVLIYLIIGFFVMRKANGGVPAMLAGDGFPKAAICLIVLLILLWPVMVVFALIAWMNR